MSGRKCRNCGSTDIETDPARGDAVCTECGFVLEDQLIVSETTFEEAPAGNMMVLGQFVASDSTGGATGFGAAYHVQGKESREITIQNAKKGITHLCMQLRLNQHCIDTSVNFYKMALSRHLTRGRRQGHNHGACVYMTCRTEGTAHLLIDISDVLQICVHELGRTYLRFTQALCINIPSMEKVTLICPTRGVKLCQVKLERGKLKPSSSPIASGQASQPTKARTNANCFYSTANLAGNGGAVGERRIILTANGES